MAPPETPPIATYTERLLQVRREFLLFHDRVEVRAHWLLKATVRTTIPLEQLSPRTTELLIRNRWAKHSILVGSLAVAAAVVFGRPGQAPWVQRASVIGWFVAGLCGALLALTAPKIRFVRVLRPDGRPGLDIAQAGPDRARFEEFLAALKRQVRRA